MQESPRARHWLAASRHQVYLQPEWLLGNLNPAAPLTSFSADHSGQELPLDFWANLKNLKKLCSQLKETMGTHAEKSSKLQVPLLTMQFSTQKRKTKKLGKQFRV